MLLIQDLYRVAHTEEVDLPLFYNDLTRAYLSKLSTLEAIRYQVPPLELHAL